VGTELTNDMKCWGNLHAWTMRRLQAPPPPKIDVRITTFKTEDALEVLMVIKIDDDKN
jgi:hypothetical protein